MGWIDDSGLHEAWLAPEFLDGVRGAGITTGQVPEDQVIVKDLTTHESYQQTGTEDFETRAAAEVIGWRIVCTCAGHGWASDLLTRVPSKALEDLTAGRIYAPDLDVAYVDERDDVAAAATARWRSEHLEPVDALTRIRALQNQISKAREDLTAVVATAKRSGASWDAIGRAAGMSRQSAHERWGR